MESKPIIIRLPKDPEERARAVAYVIANFQKTYGSNSPPEKTPEHLFIAVEGNTIVGSLAIQFGSEGPLPHEELFSFEGARLPVSGYVREESIYYSRWNSSRPQLGLVLWLVASQYAQARGAKWSASTGKPFIFENFRKWFGCEWLPVTGAILLTEKVPPSDANYFLTEPFPCPHLGIIEHQIRSLPAIVKDIRKKLTITVAL